jgi:hypothetical protein
MPIAFIWEKLLIKGHLEDGEEEMIKIIWILRTYVARMVSE